MKANNLMLYDWVCHKNTKKPFQIYRIHTNCVMDINGSFINLNNIKPIPLTPEILEKNGFVNNKDKWMQLGNFDNPPLIMWHMKDESKWGHPQTQLEIHWGANFIHMSFNCTQVHQLQHALKLCNIDKEIKT